MEQPTLLTLPAELLAVVTRYVTLVSFRPLILSCKTLSRLVLDERVLASLYVDYFGKDRILEALLARKKYADDYPKLWQDPYHAREILLSRPALMGRLLLESQPSRPLIGLVLTELFSGAHKDMEEGSRVPFDKAVNAMEIFTIIGRMPHVRSAVQTMDQILSPWRSFQEDPDIYRVLGWCSSITRDVIMKSSVSNRLLLGFLARPESFDDFDEGTTYQSLLNMVVARRSSIPRSMLISALEEASIMLKEVEEPACLVALATTFPDIVSGVSIGQYPYIYYLSNIATNRLRALRLFVEQGTVTPFEAIDGLDGDGARSFMDAYQDVPLDGELDEWKKDMRFWLKSVYPHARPLIIQWKFMSLEDAKSLNFESILRNMDALETRDYFIEIVDDVIKSGGAKTDHNCCVQKSNDYCPVTGVYRIPSTFIRWVLTNKNSTMESRRQWLEVYRDPKGNNGEMTKSIRSALVKVGLDAELA